jgi:hypothetical protein
MNYRGWLGIKDHERARAYDPNATEAFNREVHAKEQAAERARAAREAKKRKVVDPPSPHREPGS